MDKTAYIYKYDGVIEQVVVFDTFKEAERFFLNEVNGHSFVDNNDNDLIFSSYEDYIDTLDRIGNGTKHEFSLESVSSPTKSHKASSNEQIRKFLEELKNASYVEIDGMVLENDFMIVDGRLYLGWVESNHSFYINESLDSFGIVAKDYDHYELLPTFCPPITIKLLSVHCCLPKSLKIKDELGLEVELKFILSTLTEEVDEFGNKISAVVAGIANGDEEIIPFKEWQSVWHKADEYDPESYWFHASEFQI